MKESKRASEMRGRIMRGLFGEGKSNNTRCLYGADEIAQILRGGRNLGFGIGKMIEFFKRLAAEERI